MAILDQINQSDAELRSALENLINMQFLALQTMQQNNNAMAAAFTAIARAVAAPRQLITGPDGTPIGVADALLTGDANV